MSIKIQADEIDQESMDLPSEIANKFRILGKCKFMI